MRKTVLVALLMLAAAEPALAKKATQEDANTEMREAFARQRRELIKRGIMPDYISTQDVKSQNQFIAIAMLIGATNQAGNQSYIIADAICNKLWENALIVQQTIGHDILDGYGKLAYPFDALLHFRKAIAANEPEGIDTMRRFFGVTAGSFAWQITAPAEAR
jgi:hypothetical protein